MKSEAEIVEKYNFCLFFNQSKNNKEVNGWISALRWVLEETK